MGSMTRDMNGQVEHTIDEFGQDWVLDFWPTQIDVSVEWRQFDGTFDVETPVVTDALVSDDEGDTYRPARRDELKAILEFILKGNEMEKLIERCWEDYQCGKDDNPYDDC